VCHPSHGLIKREKKTGWRSPPGAYFNSNNRKRRRRRRRRREGECVRERVDVGKVECKATNKQKYPIKKKKKKKTGGSIF
jgi:hypothetical protein